MDLKTFLKLNVSSTDYYEKRFKGWSRKNRQNVRCCFHEGDTTPSLSIDLAGGGARCHSAGCGKSIGNVVHFESELKSISETEAARAIYSEFIRPIVAETTVRRFSETLESEEHKKWQEWIQKDCGISVATQKDFKLGLDLRTRRVVFPIFNRFGDCVNLRLYKLPRHRVGRDKKDVKIINYVAEKDTPKEVRYGGLELFPWANFVNYDLAKPVFIMASEKETMLAIQHGLQAICSTNGEGSWLEEWTEMFTAYNIGILMDPDSGGERAADKLFATLQSVANFCTKIILPFPPNFRGDKDFDDWILYGRGSAAILLDKYQFLLQHPTTANFDAERRDKLQSPLSLSEPTKKQDDFKSPKLPPFYSEQFYELFAVRSSTEMLNRQIRCKIIVAAMAQRSYDVPWKFRVHSNHKPPRYFCMQMGRELINFVGKDDNSIFKCVRELLHDNKATIEIAEHISITEVEVIPIAEVGEDSRYLVQRCYSVGVEIEANVPYIVSVIPTTLFQTQEKICIIVEANRISKAVETHAFSKEDYATLEVFTPEEGKTVWETLCNVANYVSENCTNIYDRLDWHIVSLLSWTSPIGFKFPRDNESYQRGWINTLALGDTKTGKSEVVKQLQQLFKCGEIVNAENCTYVGLVGGAIKMGSGQFMLRWGRIPLSDKQLLVVEELSGLSVEEISNLSDIRSSGIARLDKGGLVGRTVARTRLICLSNVRSADKTLADYLSGVRAVQQLIGHAEDISRFDLIITMVDSEVPAERINRPTSKDQSASGARDERLPFQRLIQFIWSLKPEQIQFSEKAYLACLSEAQRLGTVYHPSIPIFKSSADRYKIARVAASIATLQFSWTGQNILVHDHHVFAATTLLELLYNKPSLGYQDYSKQMWYRQSLGDEDLLDDTITSNIPPDRLPKVATTLIHSAKFTRDELTSTASITISAADQIIGTMQREHALRKGEANVWEVTPVGKKWLTKFTTTNETPPFKSKSTYNNGSGKSKSERFNSNR